MKVAVIGSGIAGIGSAWLLSREMTVDLYEAEASLGGHSRTVDLTVDNVTFPVDTGFMVFNARTYPNLIRLFRELGIEWTESEMSFSVQVPEHEIQWAGRDLNSVFAQRRNIANPRFLGMLTDIVRFSRESTRLLADPEIDNLTLGQLLKREGYGEGFTDWYLIPMGAAIWSTPPGEMLAYPAGTFLRFCDNHGLLHVTGKPKWRSVRGGARTYVQRAAAAISGEVHLASPVERVERLGNEIRVSAAQGAKLYDSVVIATHPPESLAMLADPTDAEKEILGTFGFWDNGVILHTDESFMPSQRRAWAAWNWFSASEEISKETLVLTYNLRSLQDVPVGTTVLETLNRDREPQPGTLLKTLHFDHPSFTYDAIRAQSRLNEIQGLAGVWYAGAWTRYGFHEDGLLSAVRVAESMGVDIPWGKELDPSRTSVLPEFAGKDERVALPDVRPRPGIVEPTPETEPELEV